MKGANSLSLNAGISLLQVSFRFERLTDPTF
jgi:hypothetical protein